MQNLNPNLQFAKEILIVIVLGLIAIAILTSGGIGLSWYRNQQPTSCNVASVKLYGGLVYYYGEGIDASSSADQTAAEDVRQQIEAADANPSVKAILLQVNSYGGDGVAGEDIAAALRHAGKPTVALISNSGMSAAYWAATGAQTIFASANSLVGDIGVTRSYLDQTAQDKQNGLTFISLTAGKYKDMGNPSSPLTPEEKILFQRNLDIGMRDFINAVAQNRHLSVASVTALADGSSMLGQMALQNGLIDKIGGIYDVQDYLKGKIGDVAFCP